MGVLRDSQGSVLLLVKVVEAQREPAEGEEIHLYKKSHVVEITALYSKTVYSKQTEVLSELDYSRQRHCDTPA